MSVDIVGIKNEIQGILNTANTTTASNDLSGNMTFRVKSVLTVNPDKIQILANDFPYVTIWTESKDITQADIARTQTIGKRRSELSLGIAGAVWNQNFSSDYTNDPADDDLEYLMENLETILRDNDTLNNTVTWQYPTSVEYFSLPIDEGAHLRVATLQLRCTVWY